MESNQSVFDFFLSWTTLLERQLKLKLGKEFDNRFVHQDIENIDGRDILLFQIFKWVLFVWFYGQGK